jgi:hypothetical protein
VGHTRFTTSQMTETAIYCFERSKEGLDILQAAAANNAAQHRFWHWHSGKVGIIAHKFVAEAVLRGTAEQLNSFETFESDYVPWPFLTADR